MIDADGEPLTDGKTLSPESVRIRSTQDMRSLPGYREQVDPKGEPLKRIVSHYDLSERTQCGLSSCRQWHNEGYLVELESGGFTNVGHICGKEFGEEKFQIEKTA